MLGNKKFCKRVFHHIPDLPWVKKPENYSCLLSDDANKFVFLEDQNTISLKFKIRVFLHFEEKRLKHKKTNCSTRSLFFNVFYPEGKIFTSTSAFEGARYPGMLLFMWM